MASANRAIGVAFAVLGAGLIGFGLVFGAFAWMNDGAAAGLGVLLVPAAFGAAALAIGASFFVVARLHRSNSAWRWWLQLLVPATTMFLAFGLAAEFSSFLERYLR